MKIEQKAGIFSNNYTIGGKGKSTNVRLQGKAKMQLAFYIRMGLRKEEKEIILEIERSL